MLFVSYPFSLNLNKITLVTCNISCYICEVIISIQHKGLKMLWEKDNPTRLPPGQVRKIRMILTLLDAAKTVEDMNYPGSGLHPLKGSLNGFYAVTVTGNYRIIFRFENGDAELLDYLDYH